MRSADRVHKVTVPQKVLDQAKGYSIHAKQMIYRGPFGGYLGPELSESYTFRPVNTADGLDYFALSDVHEAVDAAASAAQVKFDFIVLIGDLVSMVETEKDAQLANELAHKITKGQAPVVYARGNHEIKGEYAEDLYKYVGTRGQDYYYTATLGDDVFVVVLDMGEDHEDDWWEYYGTAQFDLYREAQTEFLKDVLKAGEYRDYRYRLALCHIPIQHVDNKFETFKNDWTKLLNQMDIDMCLSGHKHELWPFIPGQVEGGTALNSKGYYLTDFHFPGFLVGRRSLAQEGGTQSNGNDWYTGLHVQVDFTAGIQTAYYHNSGHEILNGEFPFAEGSFRKIQLELAR
jgi:predicted phosphodiesterase